MDRTTQDSEAKAFEERLRAICAGTLDNDPSILLETDGVPVGQTADVILARLIGFDDEIVDDTLQLSRVEPSLRLPVSEPVRVVDPMPMEYTPPRTARYVLQSGFTRATLDGMYARLFGVRVGPPTCTASVLFVRYKRRAS